MTLTATIKDTGDDVTCICETDGDRKTFRVTLKDFIDSISSTETQETIYYDPIRNIPDEVISFRLAKYRSLFSAKVIIQKKAGMCFFNYGGNVFNIPMPALLFELYIKEQIVDTKKTKIYALNSKMEICAYPYTNVHDDCRICWGSLKIPKVNGLAESTKILDFFLAAENNNDLLNTYTEDCLSASCTHALLTKLKNKKEFKDEWLKPLGVTFGDII